ncbi:MAG: CoA transferase [Chloroflexi bacterium]|nr:CoA transferase [Chloroflexota bacterium]
MNKKQYNWQRANNYLLAGIRALDLTDETGDFCGRMLADLGVDVIKIEKPCGSSARKLGPYYGDSPDLEKSLFWFAYNAGKRGITLDIETQDGKALMQRLVCKADFVVESFPPGFMQKLGLGYAALKKRNPRLIMTSITPFGQKGPYSKFKAEDLVSLGMGGQLYLCGDPDRPPVQIGFPQSYTLAGAQAAMGTLIAFYCREKTGIGQHVDVSIQESVQQTLLNAPQFWETRGVILRREGPFRTGLTVQSAHRQVWACKDGHVVFAIYGGKLGANTNRQIVKWMDQEGLAPALLKDMDWDNFDMAKLDTARIEEIQKPIEQFFMQHTKEELFEMSVKGRIILDPVASMKEVAESEQLKARGFWEKVEHPELGASLMYPGTFARFSKGRCGIRRRAPSIGEHNSEIFEGELGLSRKQVTQLRQIGVI